MTFNASTEGQLDKSPRIISVIRGLVIWSGETAVRIMQLLLIWLNLVCWLFFSLPSESSQFQPDRCYHLEILKTCLISMETFASPNEMSCSNQFYSVLIDHIWFGETHTRQP